VGVTLGVGIAAVNTGNNLLYLVLGLMLSTVLVSGVLSELALRRISIERTLPTRAFAGTECLIELVLFNGKRWLPSFSLRVEDRVPGTTTERRAYFLKVPPQKRETACYRRTPERRGRMQFAGYRVSTRYPFGLIEKGRVLEDPAELLVYPRLSPDETAREGLAPERSEVPSSHIGPGHDIAGIREYRSEDEARSIHWRRTAALGKLVVRERHRDAVARLTLVVDNGRPPEDGSRVRDEAAQNDGGRPTVTNWEQAFERAISRAATIAADALARGSAVDVCVRGGASPTVLPGSPPEPIWRYLALLEAVPLENAPALRRPRSASQVIDLGPGHATEGAA
jgi:uncharacterized protein (DUF58 family)